MEVSPFLHAALATLSDVTSPCLAGFFWHSVLRPLYSLSTHLAYFSFYFLGARGSLTLKNHGVHHFFVAVPFCEPSFRECHSRLLIALLWW